KAEALSQMTSVSSVGNCSISDVCSFISESASGSKPYASQNQKSFSLSNILPPLLNCTSSVVVQDIGSFDYHNVYHQSMYLEAVPDRANTVKTDATKSSQDYSSLNRFNSKDDPHHNLFLSL